MVAADGIVIPEIIFDPQALVSNPAVSVLIITYNQMLFIERAVASVLAQRTSFPYEVIIGDDASCDGTREYLIALQEQHPDKVKLIKWRENVGMHRNFAEVVGQARGDFIAFCEGDDYWLGTDKLQRQADILNSEPSCGLVHGNFFNLVWSVHAWRRRLAYREPAQMEQRSGKIYQAMLASNRIQTCTAMCRRSLVVEYRRNGPGVDRYQVGDWPLFLYVAHESEVAFINQPLAAYRRTPGSVTNSGVDKAVTRGWDAIRMADDFCLYFHDPMDLKQHALAELHATILCLASRAGDYISFSAAWGWLKKHSPRSLENQRLVRRAWMIRIPVVLALANNLNSCIESIKYFLGSSRAD